MTGLTILLAAATLGFAVAQWLRLPVIPLLLGIGVAIGALMPPDAADPEVVDSLIDIGLAFLVFFAGLSLNPQRFSGQLRAVLWVAVVQFIAVSGLGTAVSLALGFSTNNALYLGAALGTSSTLVVVRHLQRTAPAAYKRMVIGVVLVQDVALIAVIGILGHIDSGLAETAQGLGILLLLAAVAWFLQRRMPAIASRFHLFDDELLLLGSLAALFIFSGAAALAGMSFAAGAFFAGFSLSGFPVSGVVRSVLDSLNSFFLAVFFVALGMRADVDEPGVVLPCLALVATLFLVTPILVTFLSEWKAGLSSRNAITSGLLLSQTSEFSVVMALYGERLGHISDLAVSVIALLAVITMSLSAFLADPRLTSFLLGYHPLHRKMDTASEYRDHAVVLGYGAAGRWLIKPLRDAGIPMVVVDQEPSVIRELRGMDIPAIRGDAADEKILARAAASKARFILSSLPDTRDNLRVIEQVGDVPVIARVFEQRDADTVAEAGGTPILNSLATADTFMDWFDIFSEEEVESAS